MDRQIMRTGWWRTMYGRMVVALLLGAGACVAPQAKGGIVADSTSSTSGDISSGPTDAGSANDPPPCPPDSREWTNNSDNTADVLYECSDGNGGGASVDPGYSVEFKARCSANGGCSGTCQCIDCAITTMWVNGTKVFSCDMQTTYWDAYGIDLAAIGFASADLSKRKKVYNSEGDVIPMQYFVIPIIDANGEFVDWEFTTIEPNFSVEDGEVVIRDNHNRVIGDRTGITLDD